METPGRGLDCGPRASEGILSALGSTKKQKLYFFGGDENPIGSHNVYDLDGEGQSVKTVQTWDQCHEMLLTSHDKSQSIMVMDTERGVTKSELSLRRERKNWNLSVDTIAPMQKFDQYKRTDEIHLYGVGDGGHTVFHVHHDTRQAENVEEHVIKADECRKYKSYVFTCQAQTKGGFLALGRSDGAVALYDMIMKSENSTCVLDGMPGPVTSLDLSADGSSMVWTTPDFIFFTVLGPEHWVKGKKEKPRIMKLDVAESDPFYKEIAEEPNWLAIKFDAGTHGDADGVTEREIITFTGPFQVRWNLRNARKAWENGKVICQR